MIEQYIEFFEGLQKDTPKEQYKKIFHKNIRFKDPFHDIVGIDGLYNIFQNMFKKLNYCKFKVTETTTKENLAYIKWSFYFNFSKDQKIESFEGVSRVEFKKNKAISHIDYWDSSEVVYEKIPVLKIFIKFIKNKIRGL